MALYRYKLLNGGGVMRMKRWFGFLWRDHANFDNRIRKFEVEMQDLYEKLIVANDNRMREERKKKEVVKEVESAAGRMKGIGAVFTSNKFPFLAQADTDKPGQAWRSFVKFIKGTKTVRSHDGAEKYTLANHSELAGVQEITIPRTDRARLERGPGQQQGKQKGGQQGSQNR